MRKESDSRQCIAWGGQTALDKQQRGKLGDKAEEMEDKVDKDRQQGGRDGGKVQISKTHNHLSPPTPRSNF